MKNAPDILFRLSLVTLVLAVIVKIGYMSDAVSSMIGPLRIVSARPATYLIVTCMLLLFAVYLKLRECSK